MYIHNITLLVPIQRTLIETSLKSCSIIGLTFVISFEKRLLYFNS